MKQLVRFDQSASKKILSYFGKIVDGAGYVVEKNTRERVLSFDGTEVRFDNFGGVMIGSEVYIKSDIDSVVKFLEKTSNG